MLCFRSLVYPAPVISRLAGERSGVALVQHPAKTFVTSVQWDMEPVDGPGRQPQWRMEAGRPGSVRAVARVKRQDTEPFQGNSSFHVTRMEAASHLAYYDFWYGLLG